MQKRPELRRCIYCLTEKTFCSKRKHKAPEKCPSDFNREHVIHDALSKGIQANPTLVGRVCKDCNDYFSHDIDIELTRNCYEALQRFEYGMKPLIELKDLNPSSLQFQAQDSPGLTESATELQFTEVNGRLESRVPVRFRVFSKRRQDWLEFGDAEIDQFNWHKVSQEEDLDWSTIYIGGNGEEHEYQGVIDKLRRQGIAISNQHVSESKSNIYLKSYTASFKYVRAVAKIAYNYLAWVCDTISPALVLSDDFRSIREFIRYDRRPAYPTVRSGFSPLLRGETQTLRRSNGHIVLIEHLVKNGRRMIIGRVSLFNYFSHSVLLAPKYSGLIYPFEQGHHWNVSHKRCEPLRKLNKDGTLR